MTFDRIPPLRICDACTRHVFATETACPFCAAALAPAPVRPRFKVSSRLSRAQRFALAGAFAGLIGCSDSPQPEPAYGAPLPNTGGTNGGGGNHGGGGGSGGLWADGGGAGGKLGVGAGGAAGGGFAPAYGVPPAPHDTDGGDTKTDDAGDDDAGRDKD